MGSAVWQSQELDTPRISLEFVRHQALKLNSNRRHELLVLYGSVALIALTIVFLFVTPTGKVPALVYGVRIGVVLLLLGLAYLFTQVRRRGGMMSVAESQSVATSLQAYRTELLRRRDYYSYMSSWAASAPMVPGYIAIFGSMLIFDSRPSARSRLIAVVLLSIVGIWLSVLHYRRKARQFQEELDAVATLNKN